MTGYDLPLGPSILLGIYSPGFWEIALVLVVGLLVFGRRLPEIGRSMGRSIVEFKRGLHDVKDEIHRESSKEEADRARLEGRSTSGARSSVPADEARADRS